MRSSSLPVSKTSLTKAEPALTVELPFLPTSAMVSDDAGFLWDVMANGLLFGIAIITSLLAEAHLGVVVLVAIGGLAASVALHRFRRAHRIQRQAALMLMQPRGPRRFDGRAVAHICVGDDGVAMRLGEAGRFVTIQGIESVHAGGTILALKWTSGECDLPMPSVDSAVSVAARLKRSRERVSHFERQLEEIRLADHQLLRKQRDAKIWTEQIAASLQQDGGYRQQSSPREDLIAALSNPLASCRTRVCVAAALGSFDSSRYGAVIKQAAAAANEPLRDTLHKAASGQLDEEGISAAERWCQESR